MSAIKNILFPFDSNVNADSSFEYAIDLARQNQSKIIFLHTVRLDKKSGPLTVEQIRKRVENRSVKRLEEIKQHSDAYKKLNYEFHTEIGFVGSRVILKIQEYPIDLVLIEKDLLAELNGTKEEIECPIMVIPG